MEAADCDYRTALPAVLEEDPELKRAYALTRRHGLGNRPNVATIMSLTDKNLKAVALKLHSQVYQDLKQFSLACARVKVDRALSSRLIPC
jgi:hypothetical protein